jgi:hypothetical protein
MVYDTQNHLWTLFNVQNFKYLENKMFQKLYLSPSSCEWRKTHALLGPLERANLNHWTSCGVDVVSRYSEFQAMDKVHKPSDSQKLLVDRNVIQHQKPNNYLLEMLMKHHCILISSPIIPLVMYMQNMLS